MYIFKLHYSLLILSTKWNSFGSSITIMQTNVGSLLKSELQSQSIISPSVDLFLIWQCRHGDFFPLTLLMNILNTVEAKVEAF